MSGSEKLCLDALVTTGMLAVSLIIFFRGKPDYNRLWPAMDFCPLDARRAPLAAKNKK
jgi:hypothetical protein